MATKSVVIPDLGTVQLYKRKGIKRIKLSVSHDGQIRVSLPYWLPYAVGTEFARKQIDWIKSKQNISGPILPGCRIGKTHHIVYIPEPSKDKIYTRITSSGEVRIFHPAGIDYMHPTVQQAAEKASIRALKLQAEKLLPHRLRTLADKHQFEYRKVSIKKLKSRWGSCSSEKDIALNCYLMQLPWSLIDYVLLHELMHTRIMAHGATFWRELDAYVPNLKKARQEIKTHRPALMTDVGSIT